MENNLLSCSQPGFRSLHSTMSSPQATNNWSYNVDRGKVNAVVFLDSKKALTLLITRSCSQNSMHIRFRDLGCASNWVRSFLNGRNQKCFANTPVKQVTQKKSLGEYIHNTNYLGMHTSSSYPKRLRLVLGLWSVFEIIFQPQCGSLFLNLLFETPFLIIVAISRAFWNWLLFKKRSISHCVNVWMNIFLSSTFFLLAVFLFASFTPPPPPQKKNQIKKANNQEKTKQKQQQKTTTTTTTTREDSM